jgi:hypothetical protein
MGKPPNEMGNCPFASPLVTPLSFSLCFLLLSFRLNKDIELTHTSTRQPTQLTLKISSLSMWSDLDIASFSFFFDTSLNDLSQAFDEIDIERKEIDYFRVFVFINE